MTYSTDDLKKLPRWVQVVLLGRVARALVPQFDANWPDAPGEYKTQLMEAIRSAEESAMRAEPVANISSHQDQMTVIIGHAASGQYVGPEISGRQFSVEDMKRLRKAVCLCLVARCALEIAETPGTSAIHEADHEMYEAFPEQDSDAIYNIVSEELDAFQMLSIALGWNNKTPIPRDAIDNPRRVYADAIKNPSPSGKIFFWTSLAALCAMSIILAAVFGIQRNWLAATFHAAAPILLLYTFKEFSSLGDSYRQGIIKLVLVYFLLDFGRLLWQAFAGQFAMNWVQLLIIANLAVALLHIAFLWQSRSVKSYLISKCVDS